jgi:hypothetical protein
MADKPISPGLQQALLAGLPTLVGALFEGAEGAAAGAQVGLQALGQQQNIEMEEKKLKARRQEKLEDRAFELKKIEKQNEFRQDRPVSFQQTKDLFTKDTKEPVIFDPKQGIFKLPSGKQVDTKNIESAVQSRFATNLDFKKDESEVDKNLKTMKAFKDDKLVSRFRTALVDIDELEALINSKNPIAKPTVQRLLARISGEVGRLTDQDVQAFGGSQAIMSRVEQFFSTAATGQFSEENVKYIRQLMDVMRVKNIEGLEKRKIKFKNQFSNVLKKDIDTIEQLIDPKDPVEFLKNKIKNMSHEQKLKRKQELLKKRGSK